ncbi:MAG TPA: tryptophan 2,3-dioxygenase family protein [Gemmatimonadales bacterium]|jgi:tryptophan 2,3-dioxygenase|nr:tryptophan 2,3-dioxygenase family protein [Gemmatimonadales bacterium]
MSFGRPDSEARLTYGGYLHVRELTALQQLESSPPQHDEMLFIIIHQVYELWFKQVLHELDNIIGRLDQDDLLGAVRLLRRIQEIQRVLVAQLSVLETMTPVDFLSFRDHLMPASGFQSAQFREVEYLSGLKEPKFLAYYEPGTPERTRLDARLAGRSLRDAWQSLMTRRQFSADAAGVARAYTGADRHTDLFLLLEALIEYDELFLLWRLRHVQMVERVIGGKPGTGGSSGAAYLRTTTDRRVFPELWDARSLLERSGP